MQAKLVVEMLGPTGTRVSMPLPLELLGGLRAYGRVGVEQASGLGEL